MWAGLTRLVATASAEGCVRVPAGPFSSAGHHHAPSSTSSLQCARQIHDHFLTPVEVSVISTAAASAFQQYRDAPGGMQTNQIVMTISFDNTESLKHTLGETAVAALKAAVDSIQDKIESVFAPGTRPALSSAIISEIREAKGIITPEGLLNLAQNQSAYTDFHVDRAKTMRADYSALLYLDTEGDEFDGADLEFVDSAQTEDGRVAMTRTTVKPAAGRLVLFTAGHENVHGVAPIRRGSRKVIAAWFACQ